MQLCRLPVPRRWENQRMLSSYDYDYKLLLSWPPWIAGCGHIYFCPALSFFFSSPNLSGRRLDVYHTHNVVLARIQNAGLKCAVRGSLKIQDPKIAKKSPSGHHRTTLSRYIFATKAHIDKRKKVVKQQCLPHMFSQYGELRPTSDWDLLASLGHPCKFQQVSRLGSVSARHSSSGRQPNFAALNRGSQLYSAGRPSRWALAHISSYYYYITTTTIINCQ